MTLADPAFKSSDLNKMPEHEPLNAVLSDLLTLAEERLNNNDYVTLADAMKKVSQSTDDQISFEERIDLDHWVSFKVMNKDFKVNVLYEHVTVYDGRRRNKHEICYQINNIDYRKTMPSFVRHLKVLMINGVTAITTKIAGETLMWDNLAQYKKCLHKNERINNPDYGDDEDEDDDDMNYNITYVVECLFGLMGA